MRQIHYVGPYGQKTGYGQACHDYLLALHRAGADLVIDPSAPHWERPHKRYEELWPLASKELSLDPVRPDPVLVVHAPPHAAEYLLEESEQVLDESGQALDYASRVLITTWETLEMPSDMLDDLVLVFDRIIVPSRFCRGAMPTNSVDVVPHCYDPGWWTPGTHTDDKPFTFYSIIGWSERKNPIGLLKAYFHEFSVRDRVRLKLKVSGDKNQIRADIEWLLTCLNYPLEELPEYEILTEYMDDEQLLAFHRAGDCFVSANRGEGWNLPAFEAALVGNPVITTSRGGEEDFLDAGQRGDSMIDYLVGNTFTPAIAPPQLRGIEVVNKMPNGVDARQLWKEPALNALASHMRDASDRDVTPDRDFDYLRSKFSYEVVGPQLLELLLSN